MYLLACLLACLFACLLACLFDCLLACLLACLLTYKKKHLKNSSVKLIFLFKYCRDIYYSSIIEGPLPDTKKMSHKIRNFHLFYFLDNYFIFYWFLLHVWLQTKSWLIAIDGFYGSMVSYDAGIAAVNHVNRNVGNLFVSISDHGIFLWNLSFRVYLLLYKNILGTKSCTFMRKFYLRGQRKISFFLYIFSFWLLPTPL